MMLNATVEPQLSELALRPQIELAQLFLTLPNATYEQLVNRKWVGKLYAPIKVEKMPILARKAVISILDSVFNPWKGKTFNVNHTGANWWLWEQKFGHYTISVKNSLVDQQPCLWLDYNVTTNPSFLRHIRGEVRELGKDQFLARMNWFNKDKFYCVAYFSLSNPTMLREGDMS